jgi:hypothetical protein
LRPSTKQVPPFLAIISRFYPRFFLHFINTSWLRFTVHRSFKASTLHYFSISSSLKLFLHHFKFLFSFAACNRNNYPISSDYFAIFAPPFPSITSWLRLPQRHFLITRFLYYLPRASFLLLRSPFPRPFEFFSCLLQQEHCFWLLYCFLISPHRFCTSQLRLIISSFGRIIFSDQCFLYSIILASLFAVFIQQVPHIVAVISFNVSPCTS